MGLGEEVSGANVPERLEVVNVVRLSPIGKIAYATGQKFGF